MTTAEIIASVVAAVSAGLVYLQYTSTEKELTRVKNNCITTLNNKMERVEKVMEALKVDGLIEWQRGIEKRLDNGNQSFSDLERQYECQHDSIVRLEMMDKAHTEELMKLYAKIDRNDMNTRTQMKEGFDRLEKRIDQGRD